MAGFSENSGMMEIDIKAAACIAAALSALSVFAVGESEMVPYIRCRMNLTV